MHKNTQTAISTQSKHILSEIKQQQRIMDSNRMNFNGQLY